MLNGNSSPLKPPFAGTEPDMWNLKTFLAVVGSLVVVQGFIKAPPTSRQTTTLQAVPLSKTFAAFQPPTQILAQATKVLPAAALCTPCSILTKVLTFFKSKTLASFAVATLLVTTFAVVLQRILWKPSRTYNQEGEVPFATQSSRIFLFLYLTFLMISASQ